MKSRSTVETSTTLRKAAPALDLDLQKAPSGSLLAVPPLHQARTTLLPSHGQCNMAT